MRAEDAWKAALLVIAMDCWDDLEKAMRKTKGGPHSDAGHRGFEMSAGDIQEGGVQPDGYVTVDLETGILIASKAKEIVRTKLAELGVEVT